MNANDFYRFFLFEGRHPTTITVSWIARDIKPREKVWSRQHTHTHAKITRLHKCTLLHCLKKEVFNVSCLVGMLYVCFKSMIYAHRLSLVGFADTRPYTSFSCYRFRDTCTMVETPVYGWSQHLDKPMLCPGQLPHLQLQRTQLCQHLGIR